MKTCDCAEKGIDNYNCKEIAETEQIGRASCRERV